MRIKIHIRHNENMILPFDYQYAVQQWIYKTISNADAEIARRLHDIGYISEGKTFKLFCFSPWYGQPFKVEREKGIRLLSNRSEILISFLLPEVLEIFVAGLFKDQQHTFYFKGGISISILTNQIEILPTPAWTNGMMRYSLKTGARISQNMEGRKHPLYISPDHEEYGIRFTQNLLNKLNASTMNIQTNSINYEAVYMKIISDTRSHVYNIHKDGETIKSKTWSFDFSLDAPVHVHRTLYYAGAGEECSLGMGWAEMKG